MPMIETMASTQKENYELQIKVAKDELVECRKKVGSLEREVADLRKAQKAPPAPRESTCTGICAESQTLQEEIRSLSDNLSKERLSGGRLLAENERLQHLDKNLEKELEFTTCNFNAEESKHGSTFERLSSTEANLIATQDQLTQCNKRMANLSDELLAWQTKYATAESKFLTADPRAVNRLA